MTTRLLVSVRDVEEAQAALSGGADVIDVKEPLHGPLGAAKLEVIQAVCEFVSGRVPVSAACGELLGESLLDVGQLPASLAFAKIGLAGCRCKTDWQQRLLAVWNRFPVGVERVAVAYADWQLCDALPPEELIEFCSSSPCGYLLLDTTDKTKCLKEHVAESILDGWIQLARSRGLKLVVAGSVTLEQLDAIVPSWQPTYVAVRGAACDGNRESKVSQELVVALKEKLDGFFATRSGT